MSKHIALQRFTLDPRPALHSDSKQTSCGNQPAHFRLGNASTSTRSTPTRRLTWPNRSGGRDDGCDRRFTLPLDAMKGRGLRSS